MRGPRFVASYAIAVLVLACAVKCQAQQNLFNVPSAEITRPNEVFFQQQFNLNTQTQSNTSIAYGVGREYEIGLNFFQLNVVPDSGPDPAPTEPLLLFNAQKGFYLGDHFKLGVGTQIGETVVDRRRDVRMANFNYAVGVGTLGDGKSRLYGGAYQADAAFRGDRGDEFGFMVGYDIPTMIEKVDLVGDYISGTSAISLAVLGAVWDMTENWQLSLGAQLPSPHSGNAYGAVVEFTLIPHHGVGMAEPGGLLLGPPPETTR